MRCQKALTSPAQGNISFGEYKSINKLLLELSHSVQQLFIIAQLAMHLTHSLVMQSSDTTQHAVEL